MRFRDKIEFNYSIILSLESRDEWTVMLEKFRWPLLYFPNRWEKIFFYENFSTNQVSRKNRTQLFDYFVIGIERWVNTHAEKILFTFVVLSKSARKIFFFIKIFLPMRFREKVKFNYSIFFSLESRDEWTVMLKKFHWPLLYCSNRWEKIFFYENFSTNQVSRKKRTQLFDYFFIGIERWVNTDAEKILLTFVVLSKSVRKNFFLWKFFTQSDFENRSNSIIRLFCHWNREMSEHWCWKNCVDLCCILQIDEKKFLFEYKFFKQSEFERKSNWILPLFYHWNRRMSEHRCLENSVDLCFFIHIDFWRNIFRWMKIIQIWIIRFFEFWNREINEYGYW